MLFFAIKGALHPLLAAFPESCDHPVVTVLTELRMKPQAKLTVPFPDEGD